MSTKETTKSPISKAKSRPVEELAMLGEIGHIINSSLEIDEVYDRFPEQVRKLIHFDRIDLQTVDLEKGTLTHAYVTGIEVPERKAGDVRPLKDSLAEELVRRKSGMILDAEDAEELRRRFPNIIPSLDYGIRSYLGIPLVSKDRVIGALYVSSTKRNAYTEQDLELAEIIGTLVAGAIANAQLYAQSKQAEQTLAEQATKLSTSEEALRSRNNILQAILDSLIDGLLVVGKDGKILLYNNAAQEILDLVRADGSSNSPLLTPGQELEYGYTWPPFHPDMVTPYEPGESPLERAIRGEAIEGAELYFRIPNTDREYWLMMTAAPLKADDGTLQGGVGLIRNITRRKRAEADLERKAEELESSNAELEQFAYVASHDLQEPLRMITSFTQLLSKRYKGKLDSEADEFIGYAVDGASRMQVLIRDLLEFSRVGTRGAEFEQVNCELALENAVQNLKAAIDESGAAVTHDPLPTVTADRAQLLRVFQNLIGNAIKFRGKAQPEIHVAVDRQGKEWVFSAQDNGIGIDPEYKERIFAVFQRLHSSSDYQGTGIGLSICRKIVERHRGRIWIESELGKGSTFYFSIPVKGGHYL